MNGSFEIREYIVDGRSPFAEWFNGLDAVTAARVDRYIGSALILKSETWRKTKTYMQRVNSPFAPL